MTVYWAIKWEKQEGMDLTQILDGRENSGQDIFIVKWLEIWVIRSTNLRHFAAKEYN